MPLDPRLGPLGDYGGPTQTFALLPGSPALGAGGPSTTLTSPVDASATTLSVDDAAALAVTPGLTIEIDGEQLTITGVDIMTNTLTVVRGVNGTMLVPACSRRPTSGVCRVWSREPSISGRFKRKWRDFGKTNHENTKKRNSMRHPEPRRASE
jgi:hypothetical protein